MNNKGKGIFLNSSSLIDLKAEVLKKREIVTQAKLVRNQNEVSSSDAPVRRPGLTKFKKIYEENVKKKHSQTPQIIEIEDRTEEEDALRKSRVALERKAKLYEKITSGEHVPAEEEGQLYLVNFEKKVVDNILQQKAEAQEKEENISVENENKEQLIADLDPYDIPLPPEPENQWVEYVDNLGRKKCCLQKDLEYFRTVNKENNTVIEPVIGLESAAKTITPEEVGNEDNDHTVPVYYQKLKENEIRLHGVGYYGFSVKPEEREKQMDVLNKLREQTLTQRENRVKLKEKRKALIKERLAKIKKRKNIPVDDTNNSNSEGSDVEATKEKEETVAEETEPNIEEGREYEKDLKRKLHLRPWDKGKNLTEVSRPGFLSQEAKTLASHFKWIEERRNERLEEFAPPQTYK